LCCKKITTETQGGARYYFSMVMCGRKGYGFQKLREYTMIKGTHVIFAAFLVMLGLSGLGYHLGEGLLASRTADRFVTVKGLAEQYVEADVATFPISFSVAGDVLADAVSKIEKDQQIILGFLKEKGFAEAEILQGRLSVLDQLAQQYRSGEIQGNRFIINATLTVRSNKVRLVEAVSRSKGELIKKGVILSDAEGPYYFYTKLNDLKPAMIASSTQNALSSASEFAKQAGAKLGSLRRASQGIFSVVARDAVDSDDNNAAQENQVIDKKVRVVSTLEYYLQ
jgi:hypothetical protein